MKNLNDHGQAFIQVVLGIALVSLIAGGAVTMIRSSQDEIAALALKQGQLKLQEDLNMSLQRSLICRAVLHVANFDVTLGAIPVTVDLPVGDGTSGTASAAGAGVDLPEYQVHVDKLGIRFDPANPAMNPVSKGTLPNGNQLWFTYLRLETKSFPASKPYKWVDLGPFYVEVNAGAVLNCYGETDVGFVAASTCGILGGDYSPGNCLLPPKFADVSCDSGSLSGFTLSTADRQCMSIQQ